MNIAAFFWGAHPSSSYRAIHPLTELARRGAPRRRRTPSRSELTPSDEDLEVILEDFDVAFIGRYIEPEAVELARRLTDGRDGRRVGLRRRRREARTARRLRRHGRGSST